MGWGWYSYPKSKPRKPADGIKAQSKKFGQTWWSGKWIAALERLVDTGRLSRGRSYARSGQVLNIDIQPGLVTSRVNVDVQHLPAKSRSKSRRCPRRTGSA